MLPRRLARKVQLKERPCRGGVGSQINRCLHSVLRVVFSASLFLFARSWPPVKPGGVFDSRQCALRLHPPWLPPASCPWQKCLYRQHPSGHRRIEILRCLRFSKRIICDFLRLLKCRCPCIPRFFFLSTLNDFFENLFTGLCRYRLLLYILDRFAGLLVQRGHFSTFIYRHPRLETPKI